MAQDDSFQVLAEHYQKTFELSYELWKQRNRLYFVLLALVGVAVLLTFQVPQAHSLLIDWLTHLLGITGEKRITELRDGFPFALLNGILGLTILYVQLLLYQYSRLYSHDVSYLKRLETELRHRLQQNDSYQKSMAFTRESVGLGDGRGIIIARTYVISLGILLAAFFGGRLIEDLRLNSLIMIVVDLPLFGIAMTYFYFYAKESGVWFRRK